MPQSLRQIGTSINERAHAYQFGALQAIRKRLKSLNRTGSREPFGSYDSAGLWAYHNGGRTELQFNIGFDPTPDTLRYGLAFSLETSNWVHEGQILKEVVPRIQRFNEYARYHRDAFMDLQMWRWLGNHRMDLGPFGPISASLLDIKSFFFFGETQDAKLVDVDAILRLFDRLLPIYEYVESTGTSFPPSPLARVNGDEHLRTSTTMTSIAKVIDVSLRHNSIRKGLNKYLTTKYGIGSVFSEVAGPSMRIDMVVESSGRRLYFEIKTGLSARACIREALSQLLEYSYWPGAKEADLLYVIGEAQLDAEAEEFLHRIRKRFGLPIHYRQYLDQAGRLEPDNV
jgi:hypothetical protein